MTDTTTALALAAAAAAAVLLLPPLLAPPPAALLQVGFAVGQQPTNNAHLFPAPAGAPSVDHSAPVRDALAHASARPAPPPLSAAMSSAPHLPEADELEPDAAKSSTTGSGPAPPTAGPPGVPSTADAPSGPAAASALVSSTQRVKRNWLIHQLYIRQEFAECLKVIEAQLAECKGMAEYPLYVKALIRRQQGCIGESLQLFQAATVLNPHNVANLKQVGRSL